jgi:hypothetical protein
MKPTVHAQRFILIPLFVCCILSASRGYAEGTRQVMPIQTNGTGLIVSTTTTFPLGNVGSYLGAPTDDRIFIHIKDYTTESFYYGFNWEPLSPPGTPSTGTYNDVYMNIYDPSGNLIQTVHLPSTTGSAGFISSWPTAYFGSMVGGVPFNGYTPLSFTPSANGDYYVSFYRSEDGGNTHIPGGESMLAKYFDLQVYSGTTRVNGRVHCNEWAFSVYNPAKSDIQDPLSPTNAEFYGYTTDSVTIKVFFPPTGYQPLSYIVAFNSFGCLNTGNWATDRQSIVLPNLVAPYLTGGYPVFLDAPDANVYPISSIPNPPSLVDPVISGCPPGPYNIRFYAPQAGDFVMTLDLNGIPGYQANSADRLIELDGQVPGIVTYSWNGLDGLGNPVPANSKVPIVFSFRKGRINIPMYDDELNIQGFSVQGVSPTGAWPPNPTLYWDDTQLYNLGTDCSNNNNNYTGSGYDNSIVGVTPSATVGRAWDGNGNINNTIPAPSVIYGGVANDADNVQCNDFGNARLLNTWCWGMVLNTVDTLTLTCISVSGTVWDDADGSAAGTFNNIRTNSETGTNAGGAIYANLVDPISGDVLSSIAVAGDGTYTLGNAPVNAVGLMIYITTTQGVAGSLAPATAIPSNWTNTSPLIRTFNTAGTPVTGLDFGIEQLPNSNNQNYTIAMPVLNYMLPLDGIGSIASPGPLSGSDPEDGILGSGKSVVITSVPSNEQLYYNGVLVTNNLTIANYNPALLDVKFTNVSVVETSFTYAYLDAAGKEDPTPATYTINVSVVLASTMSSFSGKPTETGNLLTWTSLDETSAITFIIERSTDGTNYSAIGQVQGTGNGATVNHAFTDYSPTPNTPNYYRLEWTDENGDIAYSNVVVIANTQVSGILEVSPNPFQDQLTVRLSLAKAGAVAIRLLDGKGSTLRQEQFQGVTGINTFVVNGLADLPPSVYFMQITLTDQVFVKKVFTNR